MYKSGSHHPNMFVSLYIFKIYNYDRHILYLNQQIEKSPSTSQLQDHFNDVESGNDYSDEEITLMPDDHTPYNKSSVTDSTDNESDEDSDSTDFFTDGSWRKHRLLREEYVRSFDTVSTLIYSLKIRIID